MISSGETPRVVDPPDTNPDFEKCTTDPSQSDINNKRASEVPKNSSLWYTFEFWLSILAIGSGVVFFWRGSWTLFDHYLEPNDTEASAWYSLAIGLGILLLYYCAYITKLVPQAVVLSSDTHCCVRLLVGTVERLFTLVLGVAAVTFWRGVWMLQNEYILADDTCSSAWISVCCGVALLSLLGALRSIHAPPVGFVGDGVAEAFDIAHWQMPKIRMRCLWTG